MLWFDLQDLLPTVYRNITALFETAKTENIELKTVLDVTDSIRDNFFIQTCNIPTLQYYERLLDIQPLSGNTVEERRTRVLEELNNRQPYTLPFLKEQMNRLLGADSWTLEVDELVIKFTIRNVPFENIDSLMIIVNKTKPAHVGIELNLREETTLEIKASAYGQLVTRYTGVMHGVTPPLKLYLTAAVGNHLNVIKLIKEEMSLGLKNSKNLVDSAPVALPKIYNNYKAATNFQNILINAGATVEKIQA